ncbi:hypothetical protein NQ318_005892 [Aromia moschata]|uniref:DUF4817 domain-containing protein n=1 Tax=Aromia moschata TaxID=1265417 RepID=A0AAV8YRX7_9CUCU|nr:hypothetical protein NQ318_005892 [Aromia moschata]
MVYLTYMHKITILQMIGYGDRTRTQAEVARRYQEKYSPISQEQLDPPHTTYGFFLYFVGRYRKPTDIDSRLEIGNNSHTYR